MILNVSHVQSVGLRCDIDRGKRGRTERVGGEREERDIKGRFSVKP